MMVLLLLLLLQRLLALSLFIMVLLVVVVASKSTHSAAVVNNFRMKTTSPAAQLAIKNVLAHACDIVRVRRGLALTGVQQGSHETVNQLLKPSLRE